MIIRIIYIGLLSLGLTYGAAFAQELPFEDPALEHRATGLFQSIRCQVCQGESLDGSRAELAKDMRLLIRKHMREGETDAQIKAYLVEHYGQQILMETPFSGNTFFLWAFPLLILCAGMIIMRARNTK